MRLPSLDFESSVSAIPPQRREASPVYEKADSPSMNSGCGEGKKIVYSGGYFTVRMSRIIAVVNQKGGVGKTTTAVNLGAYLARAGQRVLLIDLDPQANATSGLGVDHKNLTKGIYEVLVSPMGLDEVIAETPIANYHVAPATLSLAGANVELVPLERREFLLKDNLAKVVDRYDYILIDSPPSLGVLTVNGLVAADEVLVPVQAEYYSLEGLSQLVETVNLVKENLRPDLKMLGVVLTMYDPRHRLSDAVLDELYKFFPHEQIFRSVIPRHIRLAEAPSHGQTILHYDPGSPGAKAYRKLATEVHKTRP